MARRADTVTQAHDSATIFIAAIARSNACLLGNDEFCCGTGKGVGSCFEDPRQHRLIDVAAFTSIEHDAASFHEPFPSFTRGRR